ncbi:hypothetical protein KUTeg_004926, partial [Tegillarca granosa]
MQLARTDQALSSDYKFKKRGNEEQQKHNNKLFVKLHEASDCLEGLTMEKATEIHQKLDERRRGVFKQSFSRRLADDEKRIRKAQDRAEKKLREQAMDRKRKLRQSATTQLGSAQSTTIAQRSGKCFNLRNNRSTLSDIEFVSSEIQSLLNKGCVEQVTEMPFVVNPLTVAFGKQNKS